MYQREWFVRSLRIDRETGTGQFSVSAEIVIQDRRAGAVPTGEHLIRDTLTIGVLSHVQTLPATTEEEWHRWLLNAVKDQIADIPASPSPGAR